MPQSSPTTSPHFFTDLDPIASPALATVFAAMALRLLREMVGTTATERFWSLSEAILQDALAGAAKEHHLDDITSPDGFIDVCDAVWEDYRFHFRHTPDLIDPDDAHPGPWRWSRTAFPRL